MGTSQTTSPPVSRKWRAHRRAFTSGSKIRKCSPWPLADIFCPSINKGVCQTPNVDNKIEKILSKGKKVAATVDFGLRMQN